MDRLKDKVLEELMTHLSDAQGMDLKALLDESKMPQEMAQPMAEDGDPKGIKIESVEVMGKPGSHDDKVAQMIADASTPSSQKTLGETIGYPGFKKGGKPTASLAGEEMPDDEDDMTDEELEELARKFA